MFSSAESCSSLFPYALDCHPLFAQAPSVLDTAELLNLKLDTFILLLKRDTLNCRESDVFHAVSRWAGAQCNRLGIADDSNNRSQMAAEMYQLVRFPTMSNEEFVDNVVYAGVLSLETVRA